MISVLVFHLFSVFVPLQQPEAADCAIILVTHLRSKFDLIEIRSDGRHTSLGLRSPGNQLESTIEFATRNPELKNLNIQYKHVESIFNHVYYLHILISHLNKYARGKVTIISIEK